MRQLKEWWSNLALRIAVLFMVASIPFLMLYLCSPDVPWVVAWAPNLAGSLFTSGLAVYFINVLIVRREQEERDRQVRGTLHVIMAMVQPHVHGLLKQMSDPSMRFANVLDETKGWKELAELVTDKMNTYQSVLDGAVKTSLERIRNCLSRLSAMNIDLDNKVSVVAAYTILSPLVIHLDKIKRRFFPEGEEFIYGGLLPLLEVIRKEHGMPDLSGRE